MNDFVWFSLGLDVLGTTFVSKTVRYDNNVLVALDVFCKILPDSNCNLYIFFFVKSYIQEGVHNPLLKFYRNLG